MSISIKGIASKIWSFLWRSAIAVVSLFAIVFGVYYSWVLLPNEVYILPDDFRGHFAVAYGTENYPQNFLEVGWARIFSIPEDGILCSGAEHESGWVLRSEHAYQSGQRLPSTAATSADSFEAEDLFVVFDYTASPISENQGVHEGYFVTRATGGETRRYSDDPNYDRAGFKKQVIQKCYHE